jgi:hypothetical protein
MAKSLCVVRSPYGLYEPRWLVLDDCKQQLDLFPPTQAPLLAEEAAVERLTSDVSRWSDL